MSARREILAHIKTNPGCTKNEISSATGWRPATIGLMIYQLRRIGHPIVCQPGYWTYSIAESQQDAKPWLRWMGTHIDTRYETMQMVRRSIP